MKVDIIETLGADTLLYGPVTARGDTITVRTAGHRSFRAGESVPLEVSLGHLHVFDAESGRRLPRAARASRATARSPRSYSRLYAPRNLRSVACFRRKWTSVSGSGGDASP